MKCKICAKEFSMGTCGYISAELETQQQNHVCSSICLDIKQSREIKGNEWRPETFEEYEKRAEPEILRLFTQAERLFIMNAINLAPQRQVYKEVIDLCARFGPTYIEEK